MKKINLSKMALELQNLVRELKHENDIRSKEMNTGCLSEYAHTATVHKYNNTSDIIKRIEDIIGVVNK